MKIDNNAVRRQLKRERDRLRTNSVSRVLMLEDLLNEEEPADALRS